MRRYSPLVCVLALFACAPSSRLIVKMGTPPPISEENGFAGEDVYLTEFVVRNKSSRDSVESEAALRDQVMAYLLNSAKFGKVINATQGVAVPDNALRLKIELQPAIEGGDINILAGYYEMFTLFAISPRKGASTLSATASLLRGRRLLSTRTASDKIPFSFIFFGMFRSAPIEAAFKTAYENVLSRIIVPIGAEGGGPGVSQAQLESMVKASVKEATKKVEKVYTSDVDKPAYQAAENANNYALVVGIEKYQQIAAADFGERDAQTVKDHLLALGFPQRNVVHLAGSLATRSNMEKYLESWLPEKVKPDSNVIVYFSGHGAPDVDTKQAFLMPWDGDAKFLQKTGYPLKRLYAGLNSLRARRVVVMLDSCFSGAGGRSVLPQGARPLIAKVDEGMAEMGKVTVLSASEADEISLSEQTQGHGLFTYYLLKGLNEQQGAVTLKGLYDYLLPRVQDGARQQNRDQTPKIMAAGQAADSRLND
ncbi:MAG: caspase family protein [Elusimicrobiota bacterium]